MPKLIILRGLPASGKTTYAKSLVGEDPEHWVRLNKDSIREMLGPYWDDLREKLVIDVYLAMLDTLMLKGINIIIDDTNLSEKIINSYIDQVEVFNEWIGKTRELEPYEIEIENKFIYMSLTSCIKRDSKRDHPVGEAVIRNMYNKYKNDIPEWKYLN